MWVPSAAYFVLRPAAILCGYESSGRRMCSAGFPGIGCGTGTHSATSQISLTAEERQELLADYLPFCEIVEVSKKCSVVCRDAKDQPFLDLAHSAKADLLVSGDRDLLVLAGQAKFPIESPDEYRRRAGRS
jgi:hypothetical protein